MKNHPLFPEKEDADILWIHVTRIERGKAEWFPEKFAADDLTDLGAVFEMFGGGDYELIARDSKRMVARCRYSVPGPSKPLVPPGAADAQGPTPPAPQAQPQGGGLDSGFLIALLKMQQDSNNQMLQVMAQVMGGKKDDSREFVAMMQQQNQAALAGQAQLFESLLKASQGGGAGQFDQFMRAFEMGMNVAAGDEPEDEQGAVQTAMQGAEQFMGMFERARSLRGSPAAPATAPPGAGPVAGPEPPPPAEPSNGAARPRMTAPPRQKEDPGRAPVSE